ncbi:hypothetical protein DOY81_009603 [Sarcophaga bullata]|nr:hypothetical protein DOY81_009603 [Sarcophaga bullata]
MLIKLIVCFTCVVMTLAASISKQNEAEKFVSILSQGEEKTEDGSYMYYYEGSDGSKRQEVGIVMNPGSEQEYLVVKGSYSYIDQNGDEIVVEYIADENGFQPQGTHISHTISQAAYDAAIRSASTASEIN